MAQLQDAETPLDEQEVQQENHAFREQMNQCLDKEPFADEANLKQKNMHELFTSQQALNEMNRILPCKASHLRRNWILAENELMHGCQTGPCLLYTSDAADE